MDKTSDKTFDQIVRETVQTNLPGWSLVHVGARVNATLQHDTVRPAADTIMPPLQELKRKYLGPSSVDASKREPVKIDSAVERTVQTAVVESKGMKKTIGVSSDGKILWHQG